jgi:enoyl-[acyl-carrier-protein] reductase (NADH)
LSPTVVRVVFLFELTNKCALVGGIANERSVAWGITQALSRGGAEVVTTLI